MEDAEPAFVHLADDVVDDLPSAVACVVTPSTCAKVAPRPFGDKRARRRWRDLIAEVCACLLWLPLVRTPYPLLVLARPRWLMVAR